MEEVVNFDLNKIKNRQVDTIVKCLLETIKENVQESQNEEYIISLIKNLEIYEEKTS